jgi:hypothetical protein
VAAKVGVDEDESITAVNGINSDFYWDGRKIDDHVKSIGRCAVGRVYRDNGDPFYFSSDCDISPGSSGGAALKDSGKSLIVLGVVGSSTEKPEQFGAALRRGRPNSGDFNKINWASFYIPVCGDFLRSVLRAANKSSLVTPAPAAAITPPTKPNLNPDDFSDFKLH